uniref:Uncharacterized protein n=1 Tax=Musa acuminata subsp. malaccensis TaxID=214687 RepID=A0A804K176_MUSAM
MLCVCVYCVCCVCVYYVLCVCVCVYYVLCVYVYCVCCLLCVLCVWVLYVLRDCCDLFVIDYRYVVQLFFYVMRCFTKGFRCVSTKEEERATTVATP